MSSTEKLKQAVKHLLPLIYYSQISTVKGVRPAEFDTHAEEWRKAQKFVWNIAEVKDGEYELRPESEPSFTLEDMKEAYYKGVNDEFRKDTDDLSLKLYFKTKYNIDL